MDSRVGRFREDHEQKLGIHTDVVHMDEKSVVVKATIINTQNFILATGLAEETRQASKINQTSALENCETSAVGRALAFLGYSGHGIASADEVENAISQQDTLEDLGL